MIYGKALVALAVLAIVGALSAGVYHAGSNAAQLECQANAEKQDRENQESKNEVLRQLQSASGRYEEGRRAGLLESEGARATLRGLPAVACHAGPDRLRLWNERNAAAVPAGDTGGPSDAVRPAPHGG